MRMPAIALAIAAYESSAEVNQFSSKYDYYLAGMVELTEQEAWQNIHEGFGRGRLRSGGGDLAIYRGGVEAHADKRLLLITSSLQLARAGAAAG